MGDLADKTYERMNTAPKKEPKRTVTIRGKTVRIVEKYMAGDSYSDTVARLIGLADELYNEFTRARDGKREQR